MAKKPAFKQREVTIDNAVSEAFSEIESLAEEMREAFDNTPESLQQSGAGEARGEAADALENIQQPDVPDLFQGDEFKFVLSESNRTPKQQMSLSRSARCSDAVAILQQLGEYLQELADEGSGKSDEVREAVEDLYSEIDNAVNEAESVEFPGMYS